MEQSALEFLKYQIHPWAKKAQNDPKIPKKSKKKMKLSIYASSPQTHFSGLTETKK